MNDERGTMKARLPDQIDRAFTVPRSDF